MKNVFRGVVIAGSPTAGSATVHYHHHIIVIPLVHLKHEPVVIRCNLIHIHIVRVKKSELQAV